MKTLYLLLSILGALVPYLFFFRHFAAYGPDAQVRCSVIPYRSGRSNLLRSVWARRNCQIASSRGGLWSSAHA